MVPHHVCAEEVDWHFQFLLTSLLQRLGDILAPGDKLRVGVVRAADETVSRFIILLDPMVLKGITDTLLLGVIDDVGLVAFDQ